MIELPNYTWFIQKQGDEYVTNTYSGSLGTDSRGGCINKTTFNYRAFVKLKNKKEPVSFCVECYWRKPWTEGGETINFNAKEFEALQKGIESAAQWLTEQNLKGV